MGAYQIQLNSYPLSGSKKHPRRFQVNWFPQFSFWLEYSPAKDAAYCLPCYLFCEKASVRYGSDVFTLKGFRNWKKVNDGKNCAFLGHIGDPCSTHNNAVKSCHDLLNQSQHIDNLLHVQSKEQILKNRLRLKTSIDSVHWLAFQACAFRGNDETYDSKNRGNFLELITLLASYNNEVEKVVLENAPYNSKYISPNIQKEILQIFASKVRKYICEEIGGSKFCIIVDEARDESKREQMALVLRFVDKESFIRERFFDIVHVKDTKALTLKKEVCGVLSRYSLDIQNIRGQGCDGASNMRGEWNGLQALFLNDCPYAYYVHCFAHRLQLALVVASREVISVHQFFSNLAFIINIICASSKRHDELQASKLAKLECLLEIGELETGKGKNQIHTLSKAGDTRWSSHFDSICSLIEMFAATNSVLQDIIDDNTSTYSQRGDADAAYKLMTSFEFVFILHLMKEIMGITDILCKALQRKDQDIVNAIQLVSTTKALIQDKRDNGWNDLLDEVKKFSECHFIDMPDLSAAYIACRGRARHQQDQITIEHYYRVEIFLMMIDKQLQELNNRFSDDVVELLSLSAALVPKNAYRAFDVDHICTLVEKYYPLDFAEQEKKILKFQLQHFINDALKHPKLKDLFTIQELCRALVEIEKSKVYYLLDRLIRLVLTLPVSIATTERAFSAMKLVKTRLRNKMEDEFLANSLILYIEREIAENFTSDSIMEDFKSLKERRALL